MSPGAKPRHSTQKSQPGLARRERERAQVWVLVILPPAAITSTVGALSFFFPSSPAPRDSSQEEAFSAASSGRRGATLGLLNKI